MKFRVFLAILVPCHALVEFPLLNGWNSSLGRANTPDDIEAALVNLMRNSNQEVNYADLGNKVLTTLYNMFLMPLEDAWAKAVKGLQDIVTLQVPECVDMYNTGENDVNGMATKYASNKTSFESCKNTQWVLYQDMEEKKADATGKYTYWKKQSDAKAELKTNILTTYQSCKSDAETGSSETYATFVESMATTYDTYTSSWEAIVAECAKAERAKVATEEIYSKALKHYTTKEGKCNAIQEDLTISACTAYRRSLLVNSEYVQCMADKKRAYDLVHAGLMALKEDLTRELRTYLRVRCMVVAFIQTKEGPNWMKNETCHGDPTAPADGWFTIGSFTNTAFPPQLPEVDHNIELPCLPDFTAIVETKIPNPIEHACRKCSWMKSGHTIKKTISNANKFVQSWEPATMKMLLSVSVGPAKGGVELLDNYPVNVDGQLQWHIATKGSFNVHQIGVDTSDDLSLNVAEFESSGTAVAKCKEGESVVSGGCSSGAGAVSSSFFDGFAEKEEGTHGFKCRAYGALITKAFAVCTRSEELYTFVHRVHGEKKAEVACPSQTKLLSLGCQLDTAGGDKPPVGNAAHPYVTSSTGGYCKRSGTSSHKLFAVAVCSPVE